MVARVRARVRVLPERREPAQATSDRRPSQGGRTSEGNSRPPGGERADARRVARDPERVRRTEGGAVARAGRPPVRRRVDH